MSDDMNIRFAKQTATIWEYNGSDSAGDPEFTSASPRQIKVRWEEKVVTVINAAGEEVISKSRVYVSEDLEEGDYLFLGTSAAADPTVTIGAHRVVAFDKDPNPTAKKFVRKAFL